MEVENQIDPEDSDEFELFEVAEDGQEHEIVEADDDNLTDAEENEDADQGHGVSILEADEADENDSDEENELQTTQEKEARLTKDRDHIEAGFQVMNRMTTNDVNTLLKRLRSKYSPLDRLPYHKREINWQQIAFREFSPEECRLAWIYLKLTTRTYRNLRELVDEVVLVYNNDRKKFRKKLLQLLPTYPKENKFAGNPFLTYAHHAWLANPQKTNGRGSYFHFRKQLRPEYENLPIDQKKIWEEFSKIEDDQKKAKVNEFYAQFPEAPLKGLAGPGSRPKGVEYESEFVGADKTLSGKPQHPLLPKTEYVASKIKKREPPPTDDELPGLRVKYAEKWKTLADSTKAKWIDLFINKCQQFVEDNTEYKRKNPDANVKLQLNMLKKMNRQELSIWEAYRNKPAPPPMTVKLLFRKLLSEQPPYKEMPPEEVDEKAWSKFNEMKKEEQMLYKMHYVRLHEKYKKELETFWVSIPDVIKTASLAMIPPKFRKSLTHLVEKISDYVKELEKDNKNQTEVVTSTEYYGADENPDLEPDQNSRTSGVEQADEDEEPLNKRRKIASVQVSRTNEATSSRPVPETNESVENHVSLIDIIHDEPGRNEPQAKRTVNQASRSKPLKRKSNKPLQPNPIGARAIRQALQKANLDSKRNMDDVIRGILESIPSLGSAFSPLYYYSKYVAQEKFWMRKVFDQGITETASLISQSFRTLGEHQKTVFVKQSVQFHQRMTEDRRKSTAQCGRPGIYFPDEPIPPPSSVEKFFYEEYSSRDRDEYDNGRIPRWNDLDLETQTIYIKKLYGLNQKYIQDYEKFMQGLNPADLLTYVSEAYKGWERNHLQPNESHRLPGSFLNLLSKMKVENCHEQTLSERQEIAIPGTSASASTDLIPLNNDDYICWMAGLDPPKKEELIPRKITEPTRSQIRDQRQTQPQPIDSDDPDSDDERIAYRGGKRVGSKRKVNRKLTALEKKRMKDMYETALEKGLPGLPTEPIDIETEN